ncbi:MAG: hypothetical protein ACK4NS_00215 [Saprospiraceae bacterium]
MRYVLFRFLIEISIRERLFFSQEKAGHSYQGANHQGDKLADEFRKDPDQYAADNNERRQYAEQPSEPG